MLLPPILELYVIWHPDEFNADKVADAVISHFRGSPFVGLIGGAVEVYMRSASWGPSSAPRPLPALEAPAGGVAVPRISVALLLKGPRLAAAVNEDPEWDRYVSALQAGNQNGDLRLLVAPLAHVSGGGRLSQIVGNSQSTKQIDMDALDLLCREIGQATAQYIGDPLGTGQMQVFVSHTKRSSQVEKDAETVDRLIDVARKTIADTHLGQFFDANAIQVGEDFADRIKTEAAKSVLLVLRTDLFSSREWCQTEVATAKQAGVPIVVVHAENDGDPRGSFLLDHVPSIRLADDENRWGHSIERALNRLVDEALKRALWRHQQHNLTELGFDWLPPHAPEPTTFVPWLAAALPNLVEDQLIAVLHPDPPLEPRENDVLEGILALSPLKDRVEILTPRTFGSRGGVVKGSEPKILPSHALSGASLAISVSDSPHLMALGMAPAQVDLAVAEVARSVFVAGGTVVYGGRIDGTGFNIPLIHEVQQYAPDRSALILCVAYPEHRKLSLEKLQEVEGQLGSFGRLIYLDIGGTECDPRVGRDEEGLQIEDPTELAASFTGLRRFMARRSDARVLLGGKTQGYLGRMPGIIEEALVAVEEGSPLYVAGGYGGAAALTGQALAPADFEWSTDVVKAPDAAVQGALEALTEAVRRNSWTKLAPGLRPEERSILAATHRAAEVASLVARGLSRYHGNPDV